MALEEFSDNRKTKVTAFSLPPNIIRRLDEATESGVYGGKSAIAVPALTEFFFTRRVWRFGIEKESNRDIEKSGRGRNYYECCNEFYYT